MKKKTQKGITLIALIITIVVLLILAVVAINAVQGDGIISHAKDAQTKYQAKSDEEKATLAGYELVLAPETGEAWKQEGATVSKGDTTLHIGDYVNYDAGTTGKHTPDITKGAGTSIREVDFENGHTLGTSELTTEDDLSWRVLGVNANGGLELISSNPTKQTLYLANDEGYLNAEDNLNNFCNDLYGKGAQATGARSLNADDINKLTNYDPNNDRNYPEYGVEWQYRFSGASTDVQYSKDGGKNWYYLRITTFRLPEETTAISADNYGIRKVKDTSYRYNITNNITEEDGFENPTDISNMICNGTTEGNIDQWLASSCVYCDSDGANFGVCSVLYGLVHEGSLFCSIEYFFCNTYRVRPVVSLRSDIQIDNIHAEKNGSSAALAWELK